MNGKKCTKFTQYNHKNSKTFYFTHICRIHIVYNLLSTMRYINLNLYVYNEEVYNKNDICTTQQQQQHIILIPIVHHSL